MSTTIDKSETVQIELEMIGRAKSGDADACAALFEAHKQRVYSLCRRATQNVEEAEELTEEVFVHIFRKLSTFRRASSFSAWLYPLAVNTVTEHLRKKSNSDLTFDQPAAKPLNRQSSAEEPAVAVPAIIALKALTNDDSVATPALAMLDVLGEPVLQRVVRSLRASKVGPIFLLVNPAVAKSPVVRQLDRSEVNVIIVANNNVESAVQSAISNCAERGIQSALVMREAAYLEFDVAEMIKFHNNARQRITFAADKLGRLEAAAINCSTSDASASTAFFGKGSAYSARSRDYVIDSYVNRLRTPADLRKLAEDALMRRCKIHPKGVEVRPGVWIAETARIHPHARVEAPAYVGPHSNLRAGVLVNHCATIERNCEVDRGCIVDNASILAGTYLGVGLEIANAVVNQNRLLDLKRGIDVEIEDSGLMGSSLVPRRAMFGWLLRTLAPTFSPASWRPLMERLETAMPANTPVPVTNKVSYGGSKSWTVFDELPRAINSERI